MNVCQISEDSEKGKSFGIKKNSNSLKEARKKLSCINKRINDLHHQRKFVYKNSVKVKKMVHNQINQIVKCFRARERSVCSDVDEIYFSLDGKITDELSKIQSIHAHCQTLVSHIEDFKEKSTVLRNIDATLSEFNFVEKQDLKPLEFISDFEAMKLKANNYGFLGGDFIKKDDFVFLSEEKDKISSDNSKLFHDKELDDENCLAPNDSVSREKSPLWKTSDIDDFQIIDLLENMNCEDIDDDSVMDETEKLNCTLQTENKLSGVFTSRNENAFRTNGCNTPKGSSKDCEICTDFNPEEEWKEILEMNKKLASWHEMTSNENVHDSKRKEKAFDNNSNSCKFYQPKEVNEWLHSKSNKLEIEETSKKMKSDVFSSPAEITKRSFKLYLDKDNIQNWLSDH